jgi:hypothetical protein
MSELLHETAWIFIENQPIFSLHCLSSHTEKGTENLKFYFLWLPPPGRGMSRVEKVVPEEV